MIDLKLVQEHYGDADLTEQIERTLEGAGLSAGGLGWSHLAPLDQFHVRGLVATREMAEGLGLEAGASVLDLGCGLGGPARFLAAVHGCRVTGIDLSRPFIGAARMLTERTGLTDRVTFFQEDALEISFPDASFDCAWTQHTAMNIADRKRLYDGIHRVLRPEGLLAIYDVVEGDGEPLIYSVPWARGTEISFLLTSEAMRQALRDAGFTEVSWADTTDAALAWFSEQQATRRAAPPSGPLASPPSLSPLSLSTVMGPEFMEMTANLAQNLEEGRVRLVQAIVRRG